NPSGARTSPSPLVQTRTRSSVRMTGSAATLRSPGGGCRSAAGSLRLGLEATPAAPAAGRTTAGARKRAPRGVDLRSRDARDDGVSDGELSRDHLRDAA